MKRDQITCHPLLNIKLNQEQIARYGIPARTVLDIIESIGTLDVGDVIEGQLRFPLVVKLPERLRKTPEAIGSIIVATPAGERVPLSRLATITATQGPSTITREWGQRRTTIQANVRGRDVGSFVAEAQQAVAAEVKLPAGRYRIEWGGQFENLQRAQLRLAIVVPAALVLILLLLYFSLDSIRLAALVFTGVPFAAVGGIAALWLRELPFSISAAVGFIALSGVAVLNGLVMVTFIRQLRQEGELLMKDAIEKGSLIRLRPVLMTASVAALGFVPMALANGVGAEVQRPLATVVIGGVLSSTLLTMFILPVLYPFFEPKLEPVVRAETDRGVRHDDPGTRDEASADSGRGEGAPDALPA
jgi:cobalt-zinc-cadmium resistance protein CzcA